MTTYYPHPLKRYQGFDPGRPDHVAAIEVVKVGRNWRAVWGDDNFTCAESPIRRKVEQYLARAAANAAECQRDRAAAHADRMAMALDYLAARKARVGGEQLAMF